MDTITKKLSNVGDTAVKDAIDWQSIVTARSTGAGSVGVSDIQWDMQNLSPAEMYFKHGPEAMTMLQEGILQGSSADRQEADLAANRSISEKAWDTTSGVVGGFVGGIANLGSMGLGLVNEDAGTWSAGKINDGMNWLNSTQSDGINAARTRLQRLNALEQQDNAMQMQKDIESGSSELVAGLRRWGKDTVGSIANAASDPTTLGQGTAEAVGSLLAGGPIAKGVKAVGTGAAMLTRAGGGGFGATRNVLAVRNSVAWPTAMVGMESGGAYVGTASEILEMDIKVLEQNPVYQQLTKSKNDGGEGLTEDAARREIANNTGLRAAAYTAPFAFAAGQLSRWAETPFKTPSIGSAATNILLKEPLEEAIQGTSAGLAQGLAVQGVDPNRDVLEGLGEQTGTSALYGATAAGSTQGPAVLGRVATSLGSLPKTLGNAWSQVQETRKQDAQSKTGMSPAAFNAAADQATMTAPTVIGEAKAGLEAVEGDPNQKAELNQYLDHLGSIFAFNGEESGLREMGVELPDTYYQSNSRFGAMAVLGSELLNEDLAPERAMELATALYITMAPAAELGGIDETQLEMLPENTRKTVQDYQTFLDNFSAFPHVFEMLSKVHQTVQSNAANVQPVSEEAINTPEGMKATAQIIAAAELAPTDLNIEAVSATLAHASRGLIKLTPAQHTNLQISRDLLTARMKQEEEMAALGNVSAKDVVSKNVLTGTDPAYKDAKSALQHTRDIVNAVRKRNPVLAQETLSEFRTFVDHMARKVAALNKHFVENSAKGRHTAPKISFTAVNPTTRELYETEPMIYVNGSSAKSIDMAQSIAMEQSTLATIYNNLVDTFPQLGGEKITPVQLDERLLGPVDDVVEELSGPVVSQRQSKPKATKRAEPTAEAPAQAGATETAMEPSEMAPEPVSRITQEQAKTLSDAGLNKRIEAIQEKRSKKANTPEDEATFKVLDDEMTAREEEVARSQQIQEQEETLQSLADKARSTIAGEFADADQVMASITDGEVLLTHTRNGDQDTIEATIDGERVGSLTYEPSTDVALDTQVEPEVQKRGVARAMYRFAAEKGNFLLGREAKNGIAHSFTDAGKKMRARMDITKSTLSEVTEVVDTGLTPEQQALIDQANALMNTPSDSKSEDAPAETTQRERLDAFLASRQVMESNDWSTPQTGTAPSGPVELNEGQKKASKEVTAFLGSDKRTYSIIGSAGTGKTTLINSILDGVKNFSVILTSPTHRANSVIKSKNPSMEVLTLHKLLGLKPTQSLEEFDAKKVEFQPGEDGEIPPNSLIVVDESSMINDALFTFITARLEASPGSKIIFMGDAAQLGPVKQNTDSKALSSTEGVSELTEVMRARNPELLDESVNVREEGKFTNTIHLKNNNGVGFFNSYENFLAKIKSAFTSAEAKKNPLLVRVVAATNAAVETYNQEIRRAIFGDKAKPYEVGDYLMGYAAYGPPDDSGDTVIANGVDYVVKSVTDTFVAPLGVRLKAHKVSIENVLTGTTNNVEVISPNNSQEDLDKLGTALADLIDRARVNRSLWKQFFQVKESIVTPISIVNPARRSNTLVAKTVDYGYAHTIHKSQGGTYSYVFVDENSINKFPNKKDQERLRYVGLTRAEYGAFVLTNSPITVGTSEVTVVQPVTEAPITTTENTADTQIEENTPEVLQAEMEREEASESPASTNTQDVVAEPTESTQAPSKGKPSKLKEAYPNLVQTTKNMFLELFKLPQTARSRTRGEASPMDTIYDLLTGGVDAIQQFTGKTLRGNLDNKSIEDYQKFFETVGGEIITTMNKKLADNLTPKIKESWDKGEPVNRWRKFKALNITEQTPEGDIRYNPELLQNAVMAGLQWLITQGTSTVTRDADSIKEITGIEEESQSLLDIESLKMGRTQEELVRALAPAIQRFWGVTTNQNNKDTYADKAYIEGIPQAVALEFMSAIKELGYLETTPVPFKYVKNKAGDLKPIHVNIHTISKFDEVPGVYDYPSLLEEVISVRPEYPLYFDNERPEIPERKMNSDLDTNTAQDKLAIKTADNIVYKFGTEIHDVFNSIPLDGLFELMGGGVITPEIEEKTNIRDLRKRKGKNQAVKAAVEHLNNLRAELTNKVEGTERTVGDVAIHYPHNMSSVSRLQQIGAQTPQGNKLVRAIISSTSSTVDLVNNKNHKELFGLALAQGLDIKIHKMTRSAANKEVYALLSGALAPAVAEVSRFMDDPSTPIDYKILQDAFKASGKSFDVPWAIQSIYEYVRFLRADSEGRANFTTNAYIEADGVTNGAIMASLVMNIGSFTVDQVKLLGKGGISFGSRKTLADLVAKDKVDIYGTAAINGAKHFGNHLKKAMLPENKDMTLQPMVAVVSLLNEFLPGLSANIASDEDGNITDITVDMERSVPKNPLTTTLYGSGISGISAKITGQLMEAIFARMTDSLRSGQKDRALGMFPDDTPEEAGRKYRNMVWALQTLTEGMIIFTEEGEFKQFNSKTPGVGNRVHNFANFTLTEDNFETLKTNIQHLFVKPLRQGIDETLGENLMRGVNVLREGMQVQSIFYSKLFARKVQEKLQARRDNPEATDFRPGDFLSDAELRDIHTELADFAPWVVTGNQSFFISKKERMTIPSEKGNANNLHFAESMDSSFKPVAGVFAPANSRVSAIPNLNIGLGDAQVMQRTLTSWVQEQLKALFVFDGVNFALDQIEAGSDLLNEKTIAAGLTNVHQAVLDSFMEFAANKSVLEDVLKDFTKEEMETLIRALGRKVPRNFDVSTVRASDITDLLNALQNRLEWSARSSEARHKALEAVQKHVDQFAATGTPHTFDGQVIADSSAEGVAEALNSLYREYMETGRIEPVDAEVARVSVPDIPTGANVINSDGIKALGSTLKMGAAEKAMFNQLLKQLPSGYRVVTGDLQSVLDFQKANGLKTLMEEGLDPDNTNGYISIDSKTIYIFNASSEVLVHELIHATTFEKVLQHYMGKSSADVKQAISNLEDMLQQFLYMNTSGFTPEALNAYQDAVFAIDQALAQDTPMGYATALNEFMAWALANKDLHKQLANVRVKGWKAFVSNAVDAIKKLIWGRKPQSDRFTNNLKFNTYVVMQADYSLAEQSANAALAHASNGSSQALQALRKKLDNQIVAFLEKTNSPMVASRQGWHPYHLGRTISADARNVFGLSQDQASTLEMVVATLATEMQIDGSSLAAAQKHYETTLKSLSEDNFINPEAADLEAERHYAVKKYEFLTSSNSNLKDNQGRSALLSTFIGLSMVSPEFQEVLRKIDVDRSKADNSSVDKMIRSQGTLLMDNLTQKITGQSAANNVQDALASLYDRLTEVVNKDNSLLDLAQGPVDYFNNVLTGMMEGASQRGIAFGQSLANSPNKVAQAAGNTIALGSRLLTDEGTEAVATTVNDWMDSKANAYPTLRRLFTDLIGRTTQFGALTDQIKIIRATIHQPRQSYRDEVPVLLSRQFKTTPTAKQWTSMLKTLAKTDITALLRNYKHNELSRMLSQESVLNSEIAKSERLLQNVFGNSFPAVKARMEQLAKYMNTGEAGSSLLLNASAIAHVSKMSLDDADGIRLIDNLVSMYALRDLPTSVKADTVELMSTDPEGVNAMIDYLASQANTEKEKVLDNVGRLNSVKGYIPSENESGYALRAIPDAQAQAWIEQGYTRVGTVEKNPMEPVRGPMGYYFTTLSGVAAVSQGMIQNIRQSVGGVDPTTGRMFGNVAGVITTPSAVRAISKSPSKAKGLRPVFNGKGDIVAYERMTDPAHEALLKKNTQLNEMMSIWRGRQEEEKLAPMVNEHLVDLSQKMYNEDEGSNKKLYIDLMDKIDDPVVADMVKLFPPELKKYIKDNHGNKFMVRRSLVEDMVGYRNFSVSDFWTGVSRWSPEVQKQVRRILLDTFGNDIFQRILKVEKFVQGLAADARTLIVVKSGIVPALNMMSNILHLVATGVPISTIVKEMPKKLVEIRYYTKTRAKKAELEIEIRKASNSAYETRRFEAQMKSLDDSIARLSIAPLLNAGEFSTVADIGDTSQDLELSSGQLGQMIDGAVNKLPDGLKQAAKYGLVSKDTALFDLFQKSTQYGDFLSKAVYFDHLMSQGAKQADALAVVSDEFINYDRLPGRTRGGLENIGLLWFYNFKLRMIKVAAKTIRNNPAHALLAGMIPTPAGVSLPMADTLLSKLWEGTFGYSIGPAMGMRAPQLNPWFNLIN